MTIMEVTALALLASLAAPLWALRRAWLPLAASAGRCGARLLLLGPLLLATLGGAGLFGPPRAAAQTSIGGTPTPAAKATAQGTPSAEGTPQPGAAGAAGQPVSELDATTEYGPTEPYYSDVLAGWLAKGYRPATQTITLPVLQYAQSDGGTYCHQAAPPSNGNSANNAPTGAESCVPASPGQTNIPAALIQSSPEVGNVRDCTADVNATSAKQGYCVASVGGKSNVLLWDNEDGFLVWKFDVAEAGLYNLQVGYYPVPGKDASIGREVLIDDRYPYLEAHRVAFDRVWVNGGPVTVDNQGNDIRPPVKEQRSWMEERANDSLGMTRDPLQFYLTPGAHTLKLNAIREPVALASLQFVPPLQEPTYAQALADWQAKGIKPVQNIVLDVQAEDATSRSDPTIRMETSNDPNSEPYSFGHIRMNTYGGYRWRLGGQWIDWQFSVPQDGLYQITYRVNQAGQGHMKVYRDIQFDGQFQYQELKEFPIDFSLFWENVCICDAHGKPYYIYLTKGEHTLTMTDRVGPIRQTVQDLQSVVTELGFWQRRIELITGQNPDPNLEYDLDQKMPDLLPAFRDMSQKLDNNVKLLASLNNGTRPDTANSLITVSDFLKRLVGRPDTIASNVINLDTYAQQLADWLLNVQQEPVWMDRFYVAAPSFQPPEAEAPLWKQAVFTIRNFFGSFIFNYSGIGSIYTPENTGGHVILDVWTARGQEWGMILKEMIETDFTPKTGIYVNLHVFPPGTLGGAQSVLLLALTSGAAPDLATGVDANTPVEFAIRHAIYPLDTFPDYPDVAKEFRPGALVQFRYPASGPDSHQYALPETQNFQMMFVRTDILDTLHLKPPQTWQDVYDMTPTLQQNAMEFYYPTIPAGSTDVQMGGMTPFLFQHGGSYYTPDGLRSALNTPEALAAFKQWTELYTDYRVPVQANFYNRFRTGEMPVGVADYNTYVSLSVAAPELIGRWRMLPMPGIQHGDVIDRSAGGSGETVLMFQQTKHKQEAWQYMKWWLSAATQQRYATEVEALLGVSARWNTSNVDALKSLPWPQQDIQAVFDQWEWFKENPIVLGGYYTPRYLGNAWNDVVLSGKNPREALETAVRDIDRELQVKQVEFNVKVPGQEQQLTEAGGGP